MTSYNRFKSGSLRKHPKSEKTSRWRPPYAFFHVPMRTTNDQSDDHAELHSRASSTRTRISCRPSERAVKFEKISSRNSSQDTGGFTAREPIPALASPKVLPMCPAEELLSGYTFNSPPKPPLLASESKFLLSSTVPSSSACASHCGHRPLTIRKVYRPRLFQQR